MSDSRFQSAFLTEWAQGFGTCRNFDCAGIASRWHRFIVFSMDTIQ